MPKVPVGFLVDTAFDLAQSVKKYTNNDKSLVTVSRKAGRKDIDKIEVSTASKNELSEKLLKALNKKREMKVDIKIPLHIDVPSPSISSSLDLISKLDKKNELIKEQTSVFRKISENLELSNELKVSQIYNDFESSVALIESISGLNHNVKVMTDLHRELGVKNSDNMEKYFLSLSQYFDFQNTGITKTEQNFLNNDSVDTKIKDSLGNEFIPREKNAQFNAESKNKIISDIETNESIKSKNNSDIETNNKIKENLDYQKNGNGAKNTNGETIKPREAKAEYHSEKAWDIKELNTTVWEDIEDSFDDFLTGLDGLTDGMGMDMENPFQYLMNLLQEDLQKQQTHNKEDLK
ncbi:hypothetical protein ALC152_03930 [Arcobacter sp. 15-2]|uniref:hypothetical protein n=1 Tax=Arcobacter sp. 15-2 TaxID=3374109 RepID=UPI00399C62AA